MIKLFVVFITKEARIWLGKFAYQSQTVVVKVLFDALRFSSTKVSKKFHKISVYIPLVSCL